MKKSRIIFTILIISAIFSRLDLFSQNLISNNGNYVAVPTRNPSTLIIQSTTNSWRKEIPKGNNGFFTPDSKQIIYKTGDSLCFQTLGADKLTYIKDVLSFKVPANFDGNWLIYQLKNKEVVLYNLVNGNKKSFSDVQEYLFDGNGRTLLLKISRSEGGITKSILTWMDLNTLEAEDIWSGDVASFSVSNYSFDEKSTQLGFMIKKKNNVEKEKSENSIWFFKKGMDQAQELVNNQSPGVERGFTIDTKNFVISKKGTKIFFSLLEDMPKIDTSLQKLDLWSYTDAVLQSKQIFEKIKPKEFAAVVSTENKQVLRIEHENEILLGFTKFSGLPFQATENQVLLCQFNGDIFSEAGSAPGYNLAEDKWNRSTLSNIYLVSTNDGTKKLIKANFKLTASGSFPNFQFSPSGNYIVFYDQVKKNNFSYEIATGKYRNLTIEINNKWEYGSDIPSEGTPNNYHDSDKPFWFSKSDQSLLIQDHYRDIWQIDPCGVKKPINLTNGLARRSHLFLTILNLKTFEQDHKIILAATHNFGIDHINHDQGFYVKYLNKATSDKLSMGSYVYDGIEVNASLDKLSFLINRESSTEPQASYFTRDFKSLTPVGVINKTIERPNSDLSTELISWKTFDGQQGSGILFKPADFDLNKKYPIIFTCYENMLYTKINRFFSINTIGSLDGISDAKYFLSHGYLIFCPDIFYKTGDPGMSAYNYVVSAAKYLAKKSFVDASKMGITGHSFGGYETNFIVTHTKIFAAAFSDCGISNLVSMYGLTNEKDDYNRMAAEESGQERLGVTPWERQDIYLKNSPIFYADRVTTPLVMVSNDGDFRVPYSQGIEFFNALRRLGKRSWLLNYNGFGHGHPADGETKFKQFFDHYLKGTPAPVWMTKGIPARLKGTTLGLAYDTTMKTPGPGLLMENEGALTPQQKELLKHRRTVNNEGRIVDVADKKKNLNTKKIKTNNH